MCSFLFPSLQPLSNTLTRTPTSRATPREATRSRKTVLRSRTPATLAPPSLDTGHLRPSYFHSFSPLSLLHRFPAWPYVHLFFFLAVLSVFIFFLLDGIRDLFSLPINPPFLFSTAHFSPVQYYIGMSSTPRHHSPRISSPITIRFSLCFLLSLCHFLACFTATLHLYRLSASASILFYARSVSPACQSREKRGPIDIRNDDDTRPRALL